MRNFNVFLETFVRGQKKKTIFNFGRSVMFGPNNTIWVFSATIFNVKKEKKIKINVKRNGIKCNEITALPINLLTQLDTVSCILMDGT